MLVNFLHPFFDPIVDCDVVSSDGYSISNLVSLDFRERSRGFLAAHFIKPPALLLFQLPFPAHVESMIIKPKVGSQISSGIAVLVAGIATNDSPLKKRDKCDRKATNSSKNSTRKNKREILLGLNQAGFGKGGRASSSPLQNAGIASHSYELAITPASAKGEHSSLFTQVAWLNDREGRTVHLQNQMFQQRPPVQGLHMEQTPDVQLGKFQRLYSLQKVTHVVLKIARLSGSSVPAIGKVEIWGQPSAFCKPEILGHAMVIQEKIWGVGKAVTDSAGLKQARTADNSKNHNFQLSCNKEAIPEDFLDPITYELMTVPLLLPSGHNIDTITLEKHIIAERSWGRLPSDPFTGKLFSDTCKPVPNSALKVRIDKFLLTSAVNISAFGRTVGRDPNLSTESNSSSLKMDRKVSLREFSKIVKHTKRESTSTQKLSGAKCERRVLAPTLCSSEQTEPAQELDHEEAVSKSLDSALRQTLQGIQMFTRKASRVEENPVLTQASITQSDLDSKGKRKWKQPQQAQTLTDSIKKKAIVLCVACDQDLSEKSIFLLPCQHIMCRTCLLSVTQQKDSDNACKVCKCKFKQSDALRVHNR